MRFHRFQKSTGHHRWFGIRLLPLFRRKRGLATRSSQMLWAALGGTIGGVFGPGGRLHPAVSSALQARSLRLHVAGPCCLITLFQPRIIMFSLFQYKNKVRPCYSPALELRLNADCLPAAMARLGHCRPPCLTPASCAGDFRSADAGTSTELMTRQR